MKTLKKNSRLEERRKLIPKETRLYVQKSHAIADRIFELLEEKKIDQRNLSKALGKYESEVSKWLTGEHNLTLQSITKLEAVLGEDIIRIPKRKQELAFNEKMVFINFKKFDFINEKAIPNKQSLPEEGIFSFVNEHLSDYSYLLADTSSKEFKMLKINNERNWKTKEEFEQTNSV